MNNSYEYDV